jgi:hypothetical protein
MCRARVAPRASVAPRRRVTARAMTRRDVVSAYAALAPLIATTRRAESATRDGDDDDDDGRRRAARDARANAYAPTRENAGNFAFAPPPGAPVPVKFPRKPLEGAFAVLLLRSAYEAIDDVDMLPMDEFQATSWKFRASEWEPYKYLYEPLRIEQGKITDPLYFDFVTFVQMACASRAIPKAAKVFEERTGAEGLVTVVRRDPALMDNANLPEAIAERCGKKIYERLRRGFDRGEDFDVAYFKGTPAPVSARGGKERLDLAVEGMRDIAEVFVRSGYALRISVDYDLRGAAQSDAEMASSAERERRVRVRVNGPATLWGARELVSRGLGSPSTEYLGFCLTAFLDESGVGSSYSERLTETEIDMAWTLNV